MVLPWYSRALCCFSFLGGGWYVVGRHRHLSLIETEVRPSRDQTFWTRLSQIHR